MDRILLFNQYGESVPVGICAGWKYMRFLEEIIKQLLKLN